MRYLRLAAAHGYAIMVYRDDLETPWSLDALRKRQSNHIRYGKSRCPETDKAIAAIETALTADPVRRINPILAF